MIRDQDLEFFRPVSRRYGITIFLAVWSLYEWFAIGSPFWGILTGALRCIATSDSFRTSLNYRRRIKEKSRSIVRKAYYATYQKKREPRLPFIIPSDMKSRNSALRYTGREAGYGVFAGAKNAHRSYCAAAFFLSASIIHS